MKSTKKALLSSALALVLCFSMLLGTTFAWFTDSVTSANNVIQTGTLDVEMYWAEGQLAVPTDEAGWTDASTGAIFNYDNWEPGYAVVRHIKIANEGTLALKYKVNVVANGTVSDLSDVIDVYYVDPAVQVADRTDLTAGMKIGTLTEVLANLGLTGNGTLPAGDDDTITIALVMQDTAGNEYQGKSLGTDFSIRVLATQLASEEDSFDEQYDADAKYPLGAEEKVSGSFDESAIDITIPAEAPEGDYELQITDLALENAKGVTTMSFDMSLLCNDEKVVDSGIEFPVVIQLPHPFLEITDVKHNGVSVGAFVYDPETLTVSFTTTGFSPFAVEYKDYTDPDYELAYEEIESTDGEKNYTITAGVFVDVNPAIFDASLKAADSEYIAVNYEKDGFTCYAVAKRATTVIAAPDTAADYVAENGNYTVTAGQSGKLYSLISGLQGNEHSTVYLLPGTYNEGTTIYVYSSMDIVGLGDKEDIKVVKLSSSNSNRHLFNATGTKSEYIEVTIRNMSLDATEKTTGGKDNAAVQSIRKSKVKCYDLVITKGTGWDAIAFYVNGNNAVDGVKYTAYLYAENCTLNATNAFNVISTAGSYKFYHSGQTYNNGKAYTQNSGSILNKTLAEDDWGW